MQKKYVFFWRKIHRRKKCYHYAPEEQLETKKKTPHDKVLKCAWI